MYLTVELTHAISGAFAVANPVSPDMITTSPGTNAAAARIRKCILLSAFGMGVDCSAQSSVQRESVSAGVDATDPAVPAAAAAAAAAASAPPATATITCAASRAAAVIIGSKSKDSAVGSVQISKASAELKLSESEPFRFEVVSDSCTQIHSVPAE